MEQIYETEKYKGQTNVDYSELQRLADSLKQDEAYSESVCISYARVSTGSQIQGTSLMLQHQDNVRQIREHYDNDILFVTEIGSGAENGKNRLLYKVLELAPRYSSLYVAWFDRLLRDMQAFLPIARLIDRNDILLFMKLTGQRLGQNSGKYHIYTGNFTSFLEKEIIKFKNQQHGTTNQIQSQDP